MSEASGATAEELLKELAPQVLGVLLRRGAPFAAAEDAVQEALLEAVRRWAQDGARPSDPRGWLVTVAWRKHLDAVRTDAARRRREVRVAAAPESGPTEQSDDTLLLLLMCCHPSLSRPSAVAMTLRAVGGLTTDQIARAYMVPVTTMAQRISRARRTIAGERLTRSGDLGGVLHVLYLIFNEGHSGAADLSTEAIRLCRQLVRTTEDPEAQGLLSLMLLHHARRASRFDPDGTLVPLDSQDRARWDTALIAEGVGVLQAALARDRLGPYQAEAAIAALHADAPSAQETDWPQVVTWYDELVTLSDTPVARLNRAVAVGEADGPQAGLRALADVPEDVHRHAAVEAHLRERAGERQRARELFTLAARRATSAPERDHLTRRAAALGDGS
ncbi:RNA polymerase sigma factor [Ornithinimicrobium cerasi]|uniref:RNA polymerase, sigma subunit, ECF family n=1 Tax=Ornithinimicrobium cerasi TaxID=2248773 RepID=A0A285VUH6_9MICO|nr:DUF6596 domain-containing protein [Ornithinimicrobium cerasi]SOC57268.1 RNA polymerase, sigma subunit, ECF family [Ornithinimicrobium cerasi]